MSLISNATLCFVPAYISRLYHLISRFFDLLFSMNDYLYLIHFPYLLLI